MHRGKIHLFYECKSFEASLPGSHPVCGNKDAQLKSFIVIVMCTQSQSPHQTEAPHPSLHYNTRWHQHWRRWGDKSSANETGTSAWGLLPKHQLREEWCGVKKKEKKKSFVGLLQSAWNHEVAPWSQCRRRQRVPVQKKRQHGDGKVLRRPDVQNKIIIKKNTHLAQRLRYISFIDG